MIIKNPWAKCDWDDVYCKSALLTKNKAIEFEILKDNQMLVELDLRVDYRMDHAGFTFGVGLFKYSIYCKFYDIRHWNGKKGNWENGDCESYE